MKPDVELLTGLCSPTNRLLTASGFFLWALLRLIFATRASVLFNNFFFFIFFRIFGLLSSSTSSIGLFFTLGLRTTGTIIFFVLWPGPARASTTWAQFLLVPGGNWRHLFTMRTHALQMSPVLSSLSRRKQFSNSSSYLSLSVNRELGERGFSNPSSFVCLSLPARFRFTDAAALQWPVGLRLVIRRHGSSADLQWINVEITSQEITKSFMTLGGLVGWTVPGFIVCCRQLLHLAAAQLARLWQPAAGKPRLLIGQTGKTAPHWLTDEEYKLWEKYELKMRISKL